MARKIIVVLHTSLDGFAVTGSGSLPFFSCSNDSLELACRITRSADAALFDGNSYHNACSFWLTRKDEENATWNEVAFSYWFNRADRYVVSSSLQAPEGAILLGECVEAHVKNLKNRHGKNIMVFGSSPLSGLLFQNGLVDECWLFINPLILGHGAPVFPGNKNSVPLQLQQTVALESGEVALRYSCTCQPGLPEPLCMEERLQNL